MLLFVPLFFAYRGHNMQFYDYDYDYALCNIPDKGLEYHPERNVLQSDARQVKIFLILFINK